MIDVRGNHRELITLSKRTSDSAIRFCGTKGAVRGSSTKRQNGVNSPFSTPPKAPGRIRSARCKNDTSDALETVNPLFPVQPLLADKLDTNRCQNGDQVAARSCDFEEANEGRDEEPSGTCQRRIR